MSILAAIVQAILQAIAWIFPISESGHSAVFHNFAGRASADCSAITGVIHIGISIGIILSLLKLFVILSKNFAFTFVDLAKKKIKGSSQSPVRLFMYMTVISFVPMVLWLTPTKNGTLFSTLKMTGYNSSIFDEGIFFILLGVLVLMATKMIELNNNSKNVSIASAITVGAVSVLLVPLSGLSLIIGVFTVLMLFGVEKKLAFRYSFVISVPVLFVMGIVEICNAEVKAGWIEVILGLIISAAVAFVCVRVLRWVINNSKLKYFGYYDISFGVIVGIIGIFQLVLG